MGGKNSHKKNRIPWFQYNNTDKCFIAANRSAFVFALQEVCMPEVLYEEVIEVDERIVLRQDDCLLPRKEPKRIVTGEELCSCYVERFAAQGSL